MKSRNVTVRDHASRMTPETTASRSFGQLPMCLPCQQQKKQLDCVAFFYDEGKTARNFERKTRLDGK